MSTAPKRSRQDLARERRRIAERVTLIGSVLDAGLGALKLVVGTFAHSQALIADGLHSLSDLATDVLVFLAARHANAEPDDEHPYGHERIETVATVVLGLVLIAVGVGVAVDAVNRMLHPDLLLKPEAWALAAAGVSIVAKEWVFRYTLAAARRLRSNLLEANAWHSRSDALSSIVVCIGVAGTMAGLDYVDAVAAVVVGYMVAHVGWRFAYRSYQELIDTALDDNERQQIADIIIAVPGVRSLHELRTRSMGAKALVDVHIMLADPRVSVSEGHQISELVRARLMRELDAVSDVMVHIDPEDDEQHVLGAHLPMRDEFIRHLSSLCAGVSDMPSLEDCTLHYLDGRIDVDIAVAGGASDDTGLVLPQIHAACRDDKVVGRVRLLTVNAPK
jgi:cation diffusion facilitator family transporter